jgi:hypothetical protein
VVSTKWLGRFSETHQAMIIYSALFGKYDRPYPAVKHKGVSWMLFTDTPEVEAPGWQVYKVSSKYGNPRTDSKFWKTHPPSGRTVWIDCHVQVLGTHTIEMFNRCLDNQNLSLWPHTSRQNIQQEAEFCVRKGLDLNALQQVQDYRELVPHPEDLPLWAGGIIARKDANEVCRFNRTWWAHIKKYPERDQLSLPTALYLSGARAQSFEGRISYNDYVGIGEHRPW